MTHGLLDAIVEIDMEGTESQPKGQELMELERVKVLIADDSRKAREGLKDLISTWPEVELVGEATDGSDVLPFLNDHEVDVVLIDVRMPGVDGVTATQQVKTRWPNIEVIVLSIYPYTRGRALDAGASEFFIKGDSPQDLRAAISSGSKTR